MPFFFIPCDQIPDERSGHLISNSCVPLDSHSQMQLPPWVRKITQMKKEGPKEENNTLRTMRTGGHIDTSSLRVRKTRGSAWDLGAGKYVVHGKTVVATQLLQSYCHEEMTAAVTRSF